jgi:hypothetical protein
VLSNRRSRAASQLFETAFKSTIFPEQNDSIELEINSAQPMSRGGKTVPPIPPMGRFEKIPATLDDQKQDLKLFTN